MQNTDTTKYIIHSKISADGIIERPDIVGAIFGQTEGLLGSDLDLRDLQKTGRIGRIEVAVGAKGGKTKGNIFIPSSLDRVETSILAASLETIDRVGPCTAKIEITQIEDVRATKRKHIIERAKYILTDMFDENLPESQEIADEVRQSVRIEEMEYYGKNKIPCGPNVVESDAIVVVEGRADVLNLLRYGIKNTICVGGTNVPPEVAELTKKKTVTAFTDGDRGGKLIIKELLQVADIDYIARAPDGKSVEDLVQREIVRALRQKIPVEQALENYSIKTDVKPEQIEKPAKGSRVTRIPKRKERPTSEVSAPVATKVASKPSMSEEKPRVSRATRAPRETTASRATRVPRETTATRETTASRATRAPRETTATRETTASRATRALRETTATRETTAPRETRAPKEAKPSVLSPQALRFKPHSDALNGTLGARLLDSKDEIIEETAVRDLVNTLKENDEGIKSVIFDGVVTQRILDIASDKGIENLIGVKKGNIAKSPASVNILTASDF
ncbi:DNA primase DnaG [Methanococcoides alaskense]|uniref:DNA primase DnaG n=1 Tax=Methanococcoides alaskense TaxID=325778 RepID=A0AA90U030_9EURY|nr:DNA primase DnaG [Methanococcoides alaskense]MDA0524710.1 DNA primase DnaG [Methanococcoides alaskense]MDR6223172.1 DNA primase [Methanococcoides alaskense]